MARPRKVPSLTPGQAAYVMERAIADQKVSSADVNRYLRSMNDEISALERRLTALRTSVVEPVAKVVRDVKIKVQKRRRRARRKALTAERQASQQLQGQYLGYLRQVPARQRKRFKEMARGQGRETAVAEMKKLLGK